MIRSALICSALACPALAEDRALIVGIDTYPGLSGHAPLTGAVTDAVAFRDFIATEMGFQEHQITLLTNQDATSDAIINGLIDKLIAETVAGDRVVIYFAGRGGRIASGAGSEQLQDVLLAADAPSVLGNLPSDALADILDIIPDRRTTLIVDASFADAPNAVVATARGSATERISAEPGSHMPFGATDDNRAVWNASAPGQPAWEQNGRGIFMQSFIEGLSTGAADANSNGKITNAELLSYLRDRSKSWCEVSTDCAAETGELTPNFAGPVQDDAIGDPAPKAVVQPVSQTAELPLATTQDDRKIGYDETIGFVTDLFLPSNDANLTLDLTGGTTLHLGKTVEFQATAEADGTLVLLDINPKGELAQIFPSSLSREGDTRMRTGQTLRIPSGQSANGLPIRIRVTEPTGKGFLLGLFVEDDLPSLTAVLPENLQGGPIPNAGQYLYELAQDLLRLQADDGTSKPVRWSATYLPYTINPS